MNRAERLDQISNQLLAAAALLTRLIGRHLRGEMSRSEAGLLNTLRGGPRRITELAELESLAQPTMTLLVKRLEQQGLVARDRADEDGRVVLVSLTPAGETALEGFIAEAGAILREYLAESPDEQLEALAAATEALEGLVTVLQRGTSR